MRCLKWLRSSFAAVFPQWQCISVTFYCCVNVVNSKVRKLTKRYEIVIHIFISHRTKFSPNPHLVEEATCFPFCIPWYGSSELHSHMPLQGPKFYIPLEWTCCSMSGAAMSFLIKNHRFVWWICSSRLKSCPLNCSLPQWYRFWIRSNVSRGIKSDIICTKVSSLYCLVY